MTLWISSGSATNIACSFAVQLLGGSTGLNLFNANRTRLVEAGDEKPFLSWSTSIADTIERISSDLMPLAICDRMNAASVAGFGRQVRNGVRHAEVCKRLQGGRIRIPVEPCAVCHAAKSSRSGCSVAANVASALSLTYWIVSARPDISGRLFSL